MACPALNVTGLVKTSPKNCVASRMKLNTKCSFTCPPEYQLQGPSYKQCRPDGRWSDSAKTVSCNSKFQCHFRLICFYLSNAFCKSIIFFPYYVYYCLLRFTITQPSLFTFQLSSVQPLPSRLSSRHLRTIVWRPRWNLTPNARLCVRGDTGSKVHLTSSVKPMANGQTVLRKCHALVSIWLRTKLVLYNTECSPIRDRNCYSLIVTRKSTHYVYPKMVKISALWRLGSEAKQLQIA